MNDIGKHKHIYLRVQESRMEGTFNTSLQIVAIELGEGIQEKYQYYWWGISLYARCHRDNSK